MSSLLASWFNVKRNPGSEFFRLPGIFNFNNAEMSYPFPKDESDRESAEFLIGQSLRTKKRQRRVWSPLRIALIFIGVSIGIMEMIAFETLFIHWTSQNQPPPLLSELNDLVPNFSVRQVLFRKDVSATVDKQNEASRNVTRDNWLSYQPRGNGFIAVNNTERYNLPDPIPFRGHSAYSIAVFHQLHCLYAIMDVYNDLTSSASAHRRDSAHDHHPQLDSHAHNHVDHCFRYLRQSLICCGDTALEGQDPNTETTGTDGTGAVHVCKDFEAIRSWADDHRLVDAKHP